MVSVYRTGEIFPICPYQSVLTYYPTYFSKTIIFPKNMKTFFFALQPYFTKNKCFIEGPTKIQKCRFWPYFLPNCPYRQKPQFCLTFDTKYLLVHYKNIRLVTEVLGTLCKPKI